MLRCMLKRTVILVLWFYSGWTFGGLLTYAIGSPEILGPVLGAALALVVAVDPRRFLLKGSTQLVTNRNP